ncbi:MAG: DUF3596 domain-containing protein [Candidatus Binatia bacterium]
MGRRVRTNQHGHLAFRLRWQGMESHEGTTLRDTPANRARVEARARIIDEEIRERRFEYLKWFPQGNLAHRFRPQHESSDAKLITVRGFFRTWGGPERESNRTHTPSDKQTRPVTAK